MNPRPRIPGQSSAIVVGVDWGATTGIACLVLATGESLGTVTVQRPNASKGRPAKPAKGKSPGVDAVAPVEPWQAWGRYSRNLSAWLSSIIEAGDIVALEDPGGHMKRDEWLSHGRARCVCEAQCSLNGATLVMVPTNRAKVEAVGHGRAEKHEMIIAAFERWGMDGAREDMSEHEADALWIAETARRGRE